MTKTHSDADVLRAAISFALAEQTGEGLEWLRAWQDGDPEAMAELDDALSLDSMARLRKYHF